MDIGCQPQANYQYLLPLHDHVKDICLLCLLTWAYPMQASLYTPNLGVYQPPIPPEGEDYFVPPEPSYRTKSLSTESPQRSPSLLPVPAPQHIPGGPPIFVHPPSQVPTRQTRTPSYDRSESLTPAPQQQPPGQPTTIINILGSAAPGVPMAPSMQPPFDLRDQPVLAPPMTPFLMMQQPSCSHCSCSESPEERWGPQQPGQPIID